MAILKALAILEAATSAYKKRNVNTPKVRESLYLLEPYIRPDWLIPQFRYALNHRRIAEWERKLNSRSFVQRSPASARQSKN